MSNNKHPVWTELDSDSDIPEIGYCEVPKLSDLEAFKLDKDSIVLVHNDNDWEVYTYTHATEDLQLVDPDNLKLQILQFTRRTGEHLAGLASYAEIVGAISHNRSGIRQFCDKHFTFQRMMKDLEWWEEFYPKSQEQPSLDIEVLTLSAGSTFKYQGIAYTLVQVPNDGAWQWMTKEGKYALCQGFYRTLPPTLDQVFSMAKHLP